MSLAEVPTADGDSSLRSRWRSLSARRSRCALTRVRLVTPTILSDDETKFRAQEQQEFKKRDLTQRVVVNGVCG